MQATGLAQTVPSNQLHGALGVGWNPFIDLTANGAGNDSGPYAGAGRGHCLQAFKRAHYAVPDVTTKYLALVTCDEIYSLRDAIGRIPSSAPVTAANVVAGIRSLGSFPIASLPAAQFGPRGAFPVSRVWTMRFDDDCQCTKYVGAARSVS